MTSQPVGTHTAQAARTRLRCARRRASLFAFLCAGVAGTCVPDESQAQAWFRELRVDSTVTATDNGNLAPDDEKERDFIVSVQPGVHVERNGPHLELRLDAALEFVDHLEGTQRDRALPSVEGVMTATLVERLLFIDASADVRQVELDPFGTRVAEGSTANRRTASTYRIAPYLLREFSPRTSMLARHEEAWANQSGEEAPDLRTSASVVRFDIKPVPVGMLVELSRLDNSYTGDETEQLEVEAARVGGTIGLLDGDLVAGVVAGQERTRIEGSSSRTGDIYGATMQWTPSPRTDFLASAEHRFFGTGGRLRFRHRTPFTMLSIEALREPATALTASGVQASGSNVATYLDAILSRSMPDPVERAVRVQNQLANLGLQSNLPGSVEVIADYAQLQTGVNVTWVMSTPRTTTTLSAYRQTLRQLDIPGEDEDPGVAVSDNKQWGLVAEFNRRLSPVTSLDLRGAYSRIRGLGELEGDSSRETGAQVGLTRALAPRTGATAGVRFRKIKAEGEDLESHDVTSIFVGLSHRF
jgi:uncharacterized protein (PEP-CTERM system associated)